jgi:hypothetical protein
LIAVCAWREPVYDAIRRETLTNTRCGEGPCSPTDHRIILTRVGYGHGPGQGFRPIPNASDDCTYILSPVRYTRRPGRHTLLKYGLTASLTVLLVCPYHVS